MRWKGWQFCEDPEDAVSSETWNGGNGTITFNHVQQSEPDVDHGTVPDVETDPWGITDGGYRGPEGS